MLSALLIADLAWASASVGLSLRSAQQQMRRFAAAAAAGEGAELEAALRRAGAAAHSAQAALDRHPSLFILRHVGFDSTLEGAARFAALGERAASLGAELLRDLESLSADDRLISEGRLIASGLDDLRLEVQRARLELDRMLDDVRSIDAPLLPGFDAQVLEVQANLDAAADLARRVEELLLVLPDLSGYDRPRRYLLALQSPSEARGGGGLIGLQGVLEVDAGRFRLGRFRSAWEFNELLDGEVGAPSWFRKLYGSLGATRDVRMVNLSPNFPAVARVLLKMQAAATGERLDGVIAMDPIAFGKLTKATGPVEGPGWSVQVDSNSARRVLLKDVYLHFGRMSSKAQNAYLEGLVRNLWDRLLGGQVAAPSLGAAWADAAATQHFKIFSKDPSEQQHLTALGIAGNLRRFGPELQMVFHNNWSGAKIDHYFRRRLATQVSLAADGSADISTTISMRNRSPGDGSLLSRAQGINDLPAGLNRMTLNILLPAGATGVDVAIDDELVAFQEGRDSGYPVIWVPVDIPARSEAEVTASYTVPRLYEPGHEARMTFNPQVMGRPDLLEVTLIPPAGHAIEGLDRAEPITDDAWRASRLLKGPATLRWRVTAR